MMRIPRSGVRSVGIRMRTSRLRTRDYGSVIFTGEMWQYEHGVGGHGLGIIIDMAEPQG